MEDPPLVLAARHGEPGREQLLLLVQADASSLVSAALIRAVSRAAASPAPIAELEPSTIPTNVLAQWERPGRSGPASGLSGASDGRWLWVLVLVLLGLETAMRRGVPRGLREAPPEATHERLA
jgi:hypothetical protein